MSYDVEKETAWLRKVGNEHTHCTGCGRALVDVEELDTLFHRKTGERGKTVWRQCPKYPRNGFVYLFFSRGIHDSFQRDRPIMGRGYR